MKAAFVPPFTARTRSALLGAAAALVAAACSSHADSLCEEIGDCSQGGDSDWIEACQSQAQDLAKEAATAGCGGAYDSYVRCADDAYVCRGNVAEFASQCANVRQRLDACLTAAHANDTCGALAARLARCSSPPDTGDASADGGGGDAAAAEGDTRAGDGGAPPDDCTAHGMCAARCYLDAVVDVCAPRPSELATVDDCSRRCVF